MMYLKRSGLLSEGAEGTGLNTPAEGWLGGTLFKYVRKSMIESHIKRKLSLDEAA